MIRSRLVSTITAVITAVIVIALPVNAVVVSVAPANAATSSLAMQVATSIHTISVESMTVGNADVGYISPDVVDVSASTLDDTTIALYYTFPTRYQIGSGEYYVSSDASLWGDVYLSAIYAGDTTAGYLSEIGTVTTQAAFGSAPATVAYRYVTVIITGVSEEYMALFVDDAHPTFAFEAIPAVSANYTNAGSGAGSGVSGAKSDYDTAYGDYSSGATDVNNIGKSALAAVSTDIAGATVSLTAIAKPIYDFMFGRPWIWAIFGVGLSLSLVALVLKILRRE